VFYLIPPHSGQTAHPYAKNHNNLSLEPCVNTSQDLDRNAVNIQRPVATQDTEEKQWRG
jgi:hypothetical protein